MLASFTPDIEQDISEAFQAITYHGCRYICWVRPEYITATSVFKGTFRYLAQEVPKNCLILFPAYLLL